MNSMTTGTLDVPGAQLYYESRGVGPLLLTIPGGNGDAAGFERLANELAARFTVVSYDRRGFARSPLDDPPDDGLRLAADSDDARRLIERLGDGPATVLGSSSGAIVALDLITRYPEQVRVVVAHEPPLLTLLPDAVHWLAFMDEVYDTYRRDGAEAAMRQFSTAVGMGEPQLPAGIVLPPPVLEMIARVQSNLPFFLEHELRQYVRTVPNLEALASVSSRIVLAGGLDSRDHVPYRPNEVLAERLGLEIVDFPGDHIGYVMKPVEFAARLADVLARVPAPGK